MRLSAFIEATLAQVYKVPDEDGGFRGGPDLLHN
ncbi:alanine:cation symporter family protein [Staphylococcus sp. Mo2-7]